MKVIRLTILLTTASLLLPASAALAVGSAPAGAGHTVAPTHSGGSSRGGTGSKGSSDPTRSPNSGMNNDGAVRPRNDAAYNRASAAGGRVIVSPRDMDGGDRDDSSSDKGDPNHESLDHLVLLGDDDSGSDKDSSDTKDDSSDSSSSDDSSSHDSSDSSSSQKHKSVSSGGSNHGTQGGTGRRLRGNVHTVIGAGVGVSTNISGGSLGSGSGVTGSGDASNLSGGSTTASSNDIKDEVHREVMEVQMKHGTAFVAHHKQVILHTPNGDIKITPGSAAYVMHLGQEVAVYNLSDTRQGDITAILPGNRTIPVAVGHQLLITRNVNSKYEEVNPAKAIVHLNTKQTGTSQGLATFDSEYVPQSALDHVPEFAHLVNSSRPNDKKIVDQILKMAIIRANLAQQ